MTGCYVYLAHDGVPGNCNTRNPSTVTQYKSLPLSELHQSHYYKEIIDIGIRINVAQCSCQCACVATSSNQIN